MDRRRFLQGLNASALVAGLTGLPATAIAAEGAALDERLAALTLHLERLPIVSPLRLVRRALAAAKLPETTLRDILAGLLVGEVFRAASEAEQQDPRWLEIAEPIAAPFARSLGALLDWLEANPAPPELARLHRRPNKLARVAQLVATGKPLTARNADLRRSFAAVAAGIEDPVGEVRRAFQAVDIAVAQEGRSLGRDEDDSGAPESQGIPSGEQDRKKGRLLMLRGLGVLLGGVVLGDVILYGAIPICLAGLVMFFWGLVLVVRAVKAVKERRALDPELAGLTPADLDLLQELNQLMAA